MNTLINCGGGVWVRADRVDAFLPFTGWKTLSIPVYRAVPSPRCVALLTSGAVVPVYVALEDVLLRWRDAS